MGRLTSEVNMVRMADTLRLLRESGITKIKIIGDAETLNVEFEQYGKCKKTS